MGQGYSHQPIAEQEYSSLAKAKKQLRNFEKLDSTIMYAFAYGKDLTAQKLLSSWDSEILAGAIESIKGENISIWLQAIDKKAVKMSYEQMNEMRRGA